MARAALFVGSIFVACGVLGGVAACSVGNDCDFGLCAEYKVPDGSLDDVAPHPIPDDCDITLSPKDEATCVVDDVGIFVSANGQIGATGTKAAPVKTIGEALQKAASTGRGRIYVCEGGYPESVTVSNVIGIYGGFDCTWAYTGVKPEINPSSGPALTVRSVNARVTIEDLSLKGFSSPATPGDSAIGALVLESTLVVRRSAIAAGAGQPGAKGGSLSNYAKLASAGNPGVSPNGGDVVLCTCADGTTSTGGHGASADMTKLTSGSAMPAVGSDDLGPSGNMTCSAGTVGADGASNTANEPLSTAPGVLTASGWDISHIADTGPSGNPGQGGGGGGAAMFFNDPGGGGGCGGCGGAGAKAGANGGASLGLLSYKSQVFLEACNISTAIGGKGGAGGDGQPGQAGGAAGLSNPCSGGGGGSGAGGDGGPGGAGGDSIAIASSGGTAPMVSNDTSLTVASGGAGGAGGTAGAGTGKPGFGGKTGLSGRSLPTL